MTAMSFEAEGFNAPSRAHDLQHRGTPTLIALVALVVSTVVVVTALTWSRAAGDPTERPPQSSASQLSAG